jgi:hypothetical protein
LVNRLATIAQQQPVTGRVLAPQLRVLLALLGQRLQRTASRVSALTLQRPLMEPRASVDSDSQIAEQERAQLVLLERLARALAHLLAATAALVKHTHTLLADQHA